MLPHWDWKLQINLAISPLILNQANQSQHWPYNASVAGWPLEYQFLGHCITQPGKSPTGKAWGWNPGLLLSGADTLPLGQQGGDRYFCLRVASRRGYVIGSSVVLGLLAVDDIHSSAIWKPKATAVCKLLWCLFVHCHAILQMGIIEGQLYDL